MSFYEQYPPVKIDLWEKVIAAFFYVIPLGFFIMIYMEHYLITGLTINLYILVAGGFGILWLISYAIKRRKKNLYLSEYGQKTDVICSKIRIIHGKNGGISQQIFLFESQGNTYSVKLTNTQVLYALLKYYKKRGLDFSNIADKMKTWGENKAGVGSSIPIIVNPEDTKNCIIDVIKFLGL